MNKILLLLLTTLPVFQGGEIDYNPRLLQKEVSGIFKDKIFQKLEIQVAGSDARICQVNGKFFEFKCEDGTMLLAYVGRVNSCRAGGCSNPSGSTNDLQNEYFDYFIIFDEAGKVKTIRIFNYEASHGQEVTIRKWLDQFKGYDGTMPLRVGKEIDTISGATVSVNTLVADVNEKLNLLNNARIEK